MRVLSILCLLLLLSASAFAYPSNVPNNYANNPPAYNSCHNCHSSYPINSGDGSLAIAGLPPTGYVGGTTYHLTLNIQDNGQDRWGFELTVEMPSGTSWIQGGTLMCTDPTHTVLSTGSGTAADFLKHTSSGTYNGQQNQASWNFDWTAPVAGTGTVTFYVSALGCNGTGGTSGDYCYNITVPVSEGGAGTPDVAISLEPDSTSIYIPAAGGILTFTAGVQNFENTTVTADIWTQLTLPTGSTYGPLIDLQNFTLTPNMNVSRLRFQSIPGNAPAGTYSYDGYIGNSPSEIWAEDHFAFYKAGTDASARGNWETWGEDFTAAETASALILTNSVLLSAYPNPFNPAAVVNFALPQTGIVSLTIYDSLGREAAVLQDGFLNAGNYTRTFNGSELSSGVYFARLQAGNEIRTEKLLLVK